MNKLITLIIATVLFSGCTKIIDLELNDDENQRLVVDAWFTTASTCKRDIRFIEEKNAH